VACGMQGVASQTSNWLVGWVERGEQLSRALSVLGLGELRASVRGLKGVEVRN
jgi:hypothetical protein